MMYCKMNAHLRRLWPQLVLHINNTPERQLLFLLPRTHIFSCVFAFLFATRRHFVKKSIALS